MSAAFSVLTSVSFEKRALYDARFFRARIETRQAWRRHVVNEDKHGV
jgi:hypothetical protein